MFDPVDPRQSFPKLEEGILQYWRKEDTFQQSMKRRAGAETFSFFDGPPFATGLPHYGHLLAGTVKDLIPRYQTMKGKYVQRRFGWDCHGLPIENLIEKEQGIKGKPEIEAMGVEAFNGLCRAAVQRYVKEWRATVDRTGRWVDMDWDYRTMDPDYMESIWWVFKQLSDKKLIVEGHKPMHVCPHCVTPLSNFEVTQGYKDITDVSAYVLFELEETEGADGTEGTEESKESKGSEEKVFFIAWTTTPWTLPGNLFLAVHPETDYVMVKHGDATYVVAEALVSKVFKDLEHELVGKPVKGKKLVGAKYLPLFPYFAEEYKDTAFTVVAGDFVTTEDGTGVVHIAPGFGEDDFQVGKDQGVPLLQHVSLDGKFITAVTDFAGMDVKPKDDPTKADQKVIAWLDEHGSLFKKESYRHSYPHCWRCDSPLLNYATSSWFVTIDPIKDAMLAANKETEWVPAHIRDGRFGKWLENARDWAISRNRYWGTPLPIWRNSQGDMEVIGGRDDVMAKNRIRFTKVTMVRHGQSEGNITRIYQGAAPGTDLTQEGKKQATAAGKHLQTQAVDVIYCSPLARARQTAEAIAKETGATIVVDERLREIDFGPFEGRSVDKSAIALERNEKDHVREPDSPHSSGLIAGMESWGKVAQRTGAFLAEKLPQHRGEHVVIVSHGDPIRGLRHYVTKEDGDKLFSQPDPSFATPVAYYWDHDRGEQFDLHKHVVDDVTWPGSPSKESVELTMVRHGETEWNAIGKIQGGKGDIPLNEKGREQAHAVAKALKGQAFDVIVSSHLKRVSETADIIAQELGLTVAERNPLFRERDYGDWEGSTEKDILANHPHITRIGINTSKIPNGEDAAHFMRRASNAYEYLQKTYAGKRVLLVTHKGFMRVMHAKAENLSYEEMVAKPINNTETITVPLHPLMKRIPEVLDCWFESGSMPYAQSHYPFEMGHNKTPPGFPADFIAENLDQTRGWFYTLTVLSSALFKKPAFWHCICGGIILAEDGKKMSKKLKNYPDPNELMERQGADALRFALMSSPVVRAEELRFSEKLVEETVRNVLLPLWNSYAFFVTYANEAGFDPTATRAHSNNPLDLYLRAEVQDLVNRVTKELDGYDMVEATKQMHETIDALTNWYIRLSRRRFAGKASMEVAEAQTADHEADQLDALHTLYESLLTISQVLAPFCPFITEAIYLNLVPGEHGSIHYTDWPAMRKLTKQENDLVEKTRLLRRVVSLGLKVRAEHKVPVRQPLPSATVAIGSAWRKRIEADDVRLLEQELNVKALSFVDDAGSLGTRIALVNARKVGPRLGGRVQEVIAAGKRGEFEVNEDGSVMILDERMGADEVSIAFQAAEGTEAKAIASEGGIVISLDTTVTDDLKGEGDVRTLIRTIQKLRKDKGLKVGEKIRLEIVGLDHVLERFKELIEQETNAHVVTLKEAAEESKHELDGTAFTLRFAKI